MLPLRRRLSACAPKQMSSKNNNNTKIPRAGWSARHLYVPTQTPDHFFLRFPEMLQGGHLLSWYHEILHARLSPVWSPPLLKEQYP